MKENKLNIEDIKILIPDYITGSLNENEKHIIQEAIDKYPEVKEFYNEMISTFKFVDEVEFEVPSPQYFNNLLPRIHQKIEEREEKHAVKNPVALIWKILVPAAAVIILFIIYMVANNPGENINDKNKTLVKTDSVKKDIEQKQILPDIKIKKPEDNTADNTTANKKQRKQVLPKYIIKENVQTEEKIKNNEEEKLPVPVESDDITDVIEDEPMILGAGESGTFEGDIENAIDELDQKEKAVLLEQLEKSNL